jgi:hypothetical protein
VDTGGAIKRGIAGVSAGCLLVSTLNALHLLLVFILQHFPIFMIMKSKLHSFKILEFIYCSSNHCISNAGKPRGEPDVSNTVDSEANCMRILMLIEDKVGNLAVSRLLLLL